MQYAQLGRAGPTVSRIALGMMGFGDPGWRPWVKDETAADLVVRRAADAGITLFDTGNHYSAGLSEQIAGRVLRRAFPRRDEYVVATKVGATLGPGPDQRGLSRRHILTAIDDSLRRLDTDYVDLYQIHRWDPHTPVEETVQTLVELVHAGKVRYLGAGSMYAWQFATIRHTAASEGVELVSMQNHYNLVYREEEREMIPLCRYLNVGVIPWSPLARGLLTGSRHRDQPPVTVRATTDAFAAELYTSDDFDTVDALRSVATARGLPPAQIALAWLLARPGVTAPIVGATSPSHIDDAVASLHVTLGPAEISQLEAPYEPHPIRGHH